MKKVHVALGIPSEYREWCWLLSPLRREKCGLPPKEEIKRIKDDALARPIVAIEPAANEGGKKRSSSPAHEPSTKRKPKTFSAVRGSSYAAEKLVIYLTSPKGPTKTFEHEPVKPAAPKVTASITEILAQQKSSVVPPVSEFVSKRPSGPKSGSASERLAAIKSGKVDSAAKVAHGPAPPSAVTDLSAEKGKSASTGSCERSTESKAGEFPEVCALLKSDLLKDVDAYAKFVDRVGKVVVRSYSFTKHPAYSRRSSLIAIMHKTLIMATEFIRVYQDVIKCANEVEVALVA